MDLIEKFGLIKVNATDRITAEDLRFCEVHQAAYEAAIQTFKELSFLWNDAVKMQKELLQEGQTQNTKAPVTATSLFLLE